MYNTPKILKALKELKAEIDKAILTVENSQKDIKKFYKKGFKAPAVRARRDLNVVIKDLKSQRADLRRMLREREVFEGTEFEGDYNE